MLYQLSYEALSYVLKLADCSCANINEEIEAVCTKWAKFREDLWCSTGSRKIVHYNEVSILVGVHKAGFDCTCICRMHSLVMD